MESLFTTAGVLDSNFIIHSLSSAFIPRTSTSHEIVSYGTSDTIDYENIIQELKKRLDVVPTVEHKCHNCGGTLEMKANEHIFKCPYCKSVYAIGINQINSRY